MNNLQTKSLTECARTGACARVRLNVLIACEESQAECAAFRELGHNAFSCDLQPCRPSGNPSWHIQGDCLPYIDGVTQFTTQDGVAHSLPSWDLIISHPPCTYLCKVSSVQLVKKIDGVTYLREDRLHKMYDGAEFFRRCLQADAPFVAVENPLPMRRAKLPPPSFYACPSWFGVKYTKKTLYWVKNLPPLVATQDYPNPKEFVRSSRGKYRSRTFPQLARAIALQWSDYIINTKSELLNYARRTK